MTPAFVQLVVPVARFFWVERLEGCLPKYLPRHLQTRILISSLIKKTHELYWKFNNMSHDVWGIIPMMCETDIPWCVRQTFEKRTQTWSESGDHVRNTIGSPTTSTHPPPPNAYLYSTWWWFYLYVKFIINISTIKMKEVNSQKRISYRHQKKTFVNLCACHENGLIGISCDNIFLSLICLFWLYRTDSFHNGWFLNKVFTACTVTYYFINQTASSPCKSELNILLAASNTTIKGKLL